MPVGPGGSALGQAIWEAPQNVAGLAKLLGLAIRQRGIPKMRMEGDAILAEDPELDTPAAAMGGRYVAVSPKASSDPDVLKHELRHTEQSGALGPAMLPLSFAEDPAAVPRGLAELAGLPSIAARFESPEAAYGLGPLERDALRHTTSNAELLREGSSMYKKPRAHGHATEAYLRAVLGE